MRFQKNKKTAVSDTIQSTQPEINVIYKDLWTEIKCWKTHFNKRDLAIGVLFEVLPSLYDLSSDFILAEKWSDTSHISACAILTYMFLSVPGLVMGLKFLYNRIFMQCCTCSFMCTENRLCRFVGFLTVLLILLAILGLIVVAAVFSILNRRDIPYYMTWLAAVPDRGLPWKVTAVMTTTFILSIKFMRVMIHGPEMKKLSVKISASESQNESTFQLFLISTLIIVRKVEPEPAEMMGITSSIIMIAKSGAENLLTFGVSNKLEGLNLGEKWKMLGKVIPVLIMTMIFRVGTAVLWNGLSLIGTAFLPLIVLFFLKCCLPSFSSLTPLDMLQGVLGEVSTPSVWGMLGREKSRNIQLGMAISHLIVNSALLFVTISGHHPQFYYKDSIYVQPVAITAFICGCLSFPLHLYQIYWMEKYNVLQKLDVLATI